MESAAMGAEGRPTLELFLVRHGQAVTNLTHAVGRCNSASLTPKGEEQARKLGLHWKAINQRFDHIFASTAIRAYHTATIASVEAGFTQKIVQSDEIVEVNRGIHEGKPAHEVFHGALKAEYGRDPYLFRCPEGESEEEVELRMWGFIERTVLPLYDQFCKEHDEEKKKKNGGSESSSSSAASSSPSTTSGDEAKNRPCLKIAIVSHGCAIRCLVRRILGAAPGPSRFGLSNTGVTEMHFSRDNASDTAGSWRVWTINNSHHLH